MSCADGKKQFDNSCFSIDLPKEYIIDSMDGSLFKDWITHNPILVPKKIANNDLKEKMYTIGKGLDLTFEERYGLILFNYFYKNDSIQTTNQVVQAKYNDMEKYRDPSITFFHKLSEVSDTVINDKKISCLFYQREEKITSKDFKSENSAVCCMEQDGKYYPFHFIFKRSEKQISESDIKELMGIISTVRYK